MASTLYDIFEKPVDRPIDGVIKADDAASLRIELDEYVITGEIGKRLEQFLDAYNNYDTANGVWISGLFGSGKSHLLKMLALLLENREVDGVPAYDIFAGKLDDDPILAGSLRKAVSIPSRSILFNIDQRAEVISKTDVDALLGVFQKVFDEVCGYYGKLPHIAQFERDLDGRDQLDAFKAAFESAAGKSWERGREEALMEGDNITAALAEATGGNLSDSKNIISQYRQDTRISIEDFALKVKAWLDKQEPGFRLNFFVDEVGQYIADNVKLMTNLQTIAESLNTKCRGQAWIIVTAQQDMASVIGDLTQQQENDFSKIQARFSNRMPLNSADVAEVIQRRLLSKNDEGETKLGLLYDREENNLRTLFDFTDESIKLKNYRERQHFIDSHPFPPYQYTLFQRAITSLSQHNAFEGKHSSIGERSMLGVFQEVCKALKDHPVDELATFDQMFEGIKATLKASVQQSIQIAEKNIEDVDPFAVRVLKALFLVKYVKEFKPSVRNIGILLLSEFDMDQSALRHKIEEALSVLERNTLIQRNGDVYEFLTNEEKDVEAEIKALPVDSSELYKELEEVVFDTILRHRKLKHQSTGTEYPFRRYLDDDAIGREQELAINVITPFSNDSSPEAIRMRSMGLEQLAVVTQPDVQLVRDLTLYKQTDKFIRQSRSGSPQPGRERIIGEKGEQNRRRSRDLEQRMRNLLGEARLFVRGEELDVGGENAQDRIAKAFQSLVDKVYTNLPMLRGVEYSEADIDRAAKSDSGLFGEGGAGLGEAEQDVLNFIDGQARNGVNVSAKNLTERFSTKPYGWPVVAILCIAASLSAKGRVEARIDSTPAEGDALAKALRNSNTLPSILLTPQDAFTSAQIRTSKELYGELFGKPADGTDFRSLGGEWTKSVADLDAEIDGLTRQSQQYPFMTALTPLHEQVQAMREKPAGWYIAEAPKLGDELLDKKEDVLDKIKSFMAGAQRGIYDDARSFLTEQSDNIAYVDSMAGRGLTAVIDDPKCYSGTSIQGLKSDLYAIKEKVEMQVLDERKAVKAALADISAKIEQLPEYQGLDVGQRQEVNNVLNRNEMGLDNIKLIPSLRDRASTVQRTLLPTILAKIDSLGRHATPDPVPGMSDYPPAPAPVPPRYINASDVTVVWPGTYLSEEADVDQYLAELKRTLLVEIRAGKKVIV